MIVFVDTSALYAVVDEGDDNHRVAIDAFHRLRDSELITHAYVVVETLALFGRRFPWPASERLLDLLLPLMEVRSVEESVHQAALVTYRESASGRISFVDRTSFAFMRANDLHRAFAFDVDFVRHGFERV